MKFLTETPLLFAGYRNCVSYHQRTSPIFSTIKEVESYLEDNGESGCFIRRVNSVSDALHRNDYNTAPHIPEGK